MSGRSGILEAAAEHWREAYGLARVLLGNAASAEEVTQEAYVRLGRSKYRAEPGRSVRPLFLTIVRNLAVDERRRARPDLLEEHIGRVADPAPRDPADEVESAEERERLDVVLAGLDELWRTILTLRDGVGCTYAEIAEVTGKSQDVVRVTLHRARKRVRAALALDPAEGGSAT